MHSTLWQMALSRPRVLQLMCNRTCWASLYYLLLMRSLSEKWVPGQGIPCRSRPVLLHLRMAA